MEEDYLAYNLLVNREGEILENYSYKDVLEYFRRKKTES
jgi:hypothetical protein